LPPEEAGGVVEIVRGREEVKVASGYDADELKPLFVAGNSMEPKIRANTPALYVPMDDVEASGIYYLKIDGRRIIKTVNVLAGGALKITSYNTEEYPEEETLLPAEDDQAGRYKSALTGLPVDFGVIGRLVMYTCVT
jgi:phage repressor protein C with HTH and peptisase S24 domain